MITVTGCQAQMAEIEKKRRKRGKDRDAQPVAEALTAAHEAEEAGMEAMRGENGRSDGDGEAARKAAIPGIEAEQGPGRFTEPVTPPAAGQFARPYLDTGHSAPSPQHGMPNVAPLPPQHPGILQPLPQSAVPTVVGSGPVVQAMAQHQARAAASMPPPSGQ